MWRVGWFLGRLLGWLLTGLRSNPFVKRNVEVEDLLLIAVFVWQGVDHLDVELGAFEGILVELADIVKKIPGKRAVRVDRRALEAEVVLVLGDLFVDGLVVEGGWEGRGSGQRYLSAFDALGGEEAALDVVIGGGGNLVVVDGDELDAGVVQRERGVAVVGEDDADGDEAVLDVGEAKEVAVPGVVAGFGGDGDLLFGVSVEGGVLVGGLYGRGLSGFVGGEADWLRKDRL